MTRRLMSKRSKECRGVHVYTSSIRKLVTNRKERKHCDVTLFSFVELISISFSRVKLLASSLFLFHVRFSFAGWSNVGLYYWKSFFFYRCELFNIICVFNVKEYSWEDQIKRADAIKNARLFRIHFVKFMFIFLIFILYIFLFL